MNIPAVRRSGALWAFVAAIGASYLLTGSALAVRELALPFARELESLLTNRTIYFAGTPDMILLAVAVAVGAIPGAFVARRAGGRSALLSYASLFGLTGVIVVVAATARQEELRGAGCCIVATLWDVPFAVGALLVLPAAAGLFAGARVARSREPVHGTNSALEAAGAYAIVGGVGVAVFAPTLALLPVVAPYGTVQLEPLPHVVTAGAQTLAAAAVFSLRAATLRPSALGALALMGLAGVAYFDLLEIWFTLFLDHKYVPVSLVVVPLASAVAGGGALFAMRRLARRDHRAPRRLGGGDPHDDAQARSTRS